MNAFTNATNQTNKSLLTFIVIQSIFWHLHRHFGLTVPGIPFVYFFNGTSLRRHFEWLGGGTGGPGFFGELKATPSDLM